MKKVIWGAGYSGHRFMTNLGEDEISFFIDIDKNKQSSFDGKSVFHPEDIKDWHELYVYVPYNYYYEISSFLKSKGLKENINFTKYENILYSDYLRVENDLKKSFAKLSLSSKKSCKKLFIGTQVMAAWDWFGSYLNNLIQNGLVNHVLSLEYSLTEEKIQEAIGTTVTLLPHIWDHRIVVKGVEKNEAILEELELFPYLKHAAEQYYVFSKEMNEYECAYLASSVRKFATKMVEELEPESVITSSALVPPYYILKCVCEEKNIPIIMTHPGTIPGTHNFDVYGEMGRSMPARFPEMFCNLPLNESDLKLAQEVWDYLYNSKSNRKRQPQRSVKDEVMKQIMIDRPIVFFAGQCDVFAQMVPYTDFVKNYSSPIFKSSIDCGVYLSKLCKKNNWNCIYKPHPLYVHPDDRERLPDNTIYIENADINELIDIADVVVAIVSTTSYNALTRYKPVVMLGYTQTRGKGCAYEAFEKDMIEETIKKALDYGFTKEQQKAFLKHIAQCFKYYLYDDLQERPIRYGRPVPKSIDEFYELENLLKG